MDQVTEVEDLGWFRHDNRMRRDAKIRALNDQTYRLWNALMEIASEQRTQGLIRFLPGVPFSLEQLADEAKVCIESVQPGLEALTRFLMIEERPDGIFLVNFAKRQYQSDVSTPRVKAFRERSKQDEGNADETFQERHGNDEVTPPDTDTDTDKNNVRSDKRTSDYSSEFEGFWVVYPRKLDKKGAFAKWKATTRKLGPDVVPSLMRAVIRYADECRRKGKEADFILHAATFLGPKERWRDWLTAPDSSGVSSGTRQAPAEDDVARKLRELEEQEHGEPH